MIKFEKFGKTIKIRNDDWKKLKKRFDAKKAEWEALREEYFIWMKCSLCESYRHRCKICPFSEFYADENGCIEFLDRLFKPRRFEVGRVSVSWPRQANKIARKQLGQILKIMDEIEASQ